MKYMPFDLLSRVEEIQLDLDPLVNIWYLRIFLASALGPQIPVAGYFFLRPALYYGLKI